MQNIAVGKELRNGSRGHQQKNHDGSEQTSISRWLVLFCRSEGRGYRRWTDPFLIWKVGHCVDDTQKHRFSVRHSC